MTEHYFIFKIFIKLKSLYRYNFALNKFVKSIKFPRGQENAGKIIIINI